MNEPNSFTAAKLRADGAPDDIVGHGTKADGTHVPLTREVAAVILEEAETRKAKREADMPTDQDAINAMFEAWQRLKELGWSEAQYCPKDGSSFDVIEPGSTGIFRCHYTGEWPDGSWWVESNGDLWPSRPILFRLDPEAEAARKAKMAEARRRYLAEQYEGVMSDQPTQPTLPPYVVKGQWIDPDPDPISGPRQHPYGLAAYQIGNVETGEVRIYPSRGAAMGWVLS